MKIKEKNKNFVETDKIHKSTTCQKTHQKI